MISLVVQLLLIGCLFINYLTCEPKFRLNPEEVCSGTPPELLVWIHTAPTNHRKRNAIRMTWGNPRFYDTSVYVAKVIFFVGLPPIGAKEFNNTVSPSRLQHRLEYEMEVYGDLVQGEYVDSYKNMTHKAVHSLWWISKYCSAARFIMKVDDDILVNVFKLLPYLRLKQYKEFYPVGIISCNLWINREPIRETDSKWYISKDEYSGRLYPPFCQGMVYFMTPDLLPRLYNESFNVPYIFMDDVYITGLLANRLTNPIVEFRKLSAEYAGVYGIGDRVVTYVQTHISSVTFVHTDNIDSYFEAWHIIELANLVWDIDKQVKQVTKNEQRRKNRPVDK